MGRRHADYGVQDEQYNAVGEALLWTLRKGLGDQFTAEVEDAWATAYTVLASTMMKGAARAAVAVA
jgi:hemoglobin-like flavoprotein